MACLCLEPPYASRRTARCCRGVGVFAGYNRPADNTHAFQDGFFRTGDTGVLDDQGRLTLTGRIKDVIVTAGGKTVSPLSGKAMWKVTP
ncbi:AMP-binding protein [Arthrobacter alpinus]|nr:AMP-binding protein [Arthrobacter alpinus]